MALQIITLRKLLRFFYATNAMRASLLREDIRSELQKEDRGESGGKGGGNFHVPFWSDAKLHVLGVVDLTVATQEQVEKNWRRKRLYPLLAAGFLKWWNEVRRRINEPIRLIRDTISARYSIPELKTTVRIENLLCIRVGENSDRAIYPYFSEDPALTDEAARLALWLLSNALKHRNLVEIQILDVMRGRSYSNLHMDFRGDERKLLVSKLKLLISEWSDLRKRY